MEAPYDGGGGNRQAENNFLKGSVCGVRGGVKPCTESPSGRATAFCTAEGIVAEREVLARLTQGGSRVRVDAPDLSIQNAKRPGAGLQGVMNSIRKDPEED